MRTGRRHVYRSIEGGHDSSGETVATARVSQVPGQIWQRGSQVKFRPDIDGLRGVAVLLVVAYHAKLGPVPAGYIGVDVFLVISGVLITAILIDLVDQGQFSAATFFARRMRRLMPAVVVTLAGTLLAGWFILGPRELRTLAGSSIAVLGLAANFFFGSPVTPRLSRTLAGDPAMLLRRRRHAAHERASG